MPFDVKVERHHDYVRYAIAGRTSLKRFARLFVGMSTDIDQFEDDRVLLDLRAAEHVNDFATPGVMNLLCRVGDCGRAVSPVVAG